MNSSNSGIPSPSPADRKPPYGFAEDYKEKHGCVWFQGDAMYFSPNKRHSTRVPDFHEPKWEPTRKDYNANFFQTPQWYRGLPWAWLSMVPVSVHPSQDGSIFEMFKDHNLVFEPEKTADGRFHIVPHKLSRRWKCFEEDAGAVVGTIFEYFNIAQAQAVSLPSPDNLAGYTSLYRTPTEAINSAYEARLWFLIQLGTLLYACRWAWRFKPTRDGKEIVLRPEDFPSVRMASDQADDIVSPIKFFPLWFIRVAAIRPNLIPFLSLLRSTFSRFLDYIDHAGMFIRVEDVHELGHLSYFIEHRVPVAYPWGDAEEDYVRLSPKYASYRPPVSLVQAAIASSHRIPAPLQVGYEGHDVDMNHETYLTVESDIDVGLQSHFESFQEEDRPPTPSSYGSHYNPRTTMQEYFETRDVIIKNKKDYFETAKERQERLSKRATPSRNTSLWLWRTNSAGELIRIRIASRWRAVLEAPDSGWLRRYDDFNDVVDYARTFDPKPEDLPTYLPATLTSGEIRRLTHRLRDMRRRGIPEMEGPELEEQDWRDDTALDVVTHRFGFLPAEDTVPRSQQEADALYRRIHEALQLYNGSTQSPACPPDLLPYVATLDVFLNSFKPGAGEDGEVNPMPERRLWDVHPFPYPTARDSASLRTAVRLDANYFSIGQVEGSPWSLVVMNHVDILHACRLRDAGLSVRQVALHFLDRGIPFRAMVPVKNIVSEHRQSTRQTPHTIEVRLKGYAWKHEDYVEYCRLRRAILLSPGVGFAAFQHGGIVWRIAREELGRLPEATFVAGPDLSGIVELSTDVEGWVDNRLSNETVAAICGVYHVPSMPQSEMIRLSEMSEDGLFQELADLAGTNSASHDHSGVRSNSTAAPSSSRLSALTTHSRYSPYPATTNRGRQPQTTNRTPSGSRSASSVQSSSGQPLPPVPARMYPVARLSWFPTPDTLSAARKGNLGHWTGKMEKMWLKRVEEIETKSGKPKTASGWADMSFGSMGKHLWRAADAASTHVFAHS